MNNIDDVDKKILQILMENSDIAYTELAKKIHVSSGTVHVRMKKLKEMGIVKGANLKVDYKALGYDICAFLGIYLDKSSMYESVQDRLAEIDEVTGMHYTTGQYGIFAKIVCRDTEHLRDVLSNKVQKIKGIQRTETFISLEESVNRPLKITD